MPGQRKTCIYAPYVIHQSHQHRPSMFFMWIIFLCFSEHTDTNRTTSFRGRYIKGVVHGLQSGVVDSRSEHPCCQVDYLPTCAPRIRSSSHTIITHMFPISMNNASQPAFVPMSMQSCRVATPFPWISLKDKVLIRLGDTRVCFLSKYRQLYF